MRTYKSIGYKKRHYEDFARLLGTCESHVGLIEQIAQLFATDNPRFDHMKFYARIAEYQQGMRNADGELMRRVK